MQADAPGSGYADDFYPAEPIGREGEPPRADIVRLKRLALTHGGARFQRDWYLNDAINRPTCRDLLKSGAVQSGAGATLRRGRPCECFQNSVRYATRHPGYAIVHGLALTHDDGCWRAHAWCVAPDGHIVETTTRRSVYFGVPFRAHHFTRKEWADMKRKAAQAGARTTRERKGRPPSSREP